MKTLTYKQPWATLIAAGIKDIENRTWKTNFRGRTLIHASATKYDERNNNIIFTEAQKHKLSDPVITINNSSNRLGLYYIAPLDLSITSAIIGEVDIIDCVQNHSSIWALPNHYHWVLANAVMYDEPILNVKGKLSFWEYEIN